MGRKKILESISKADNTQKAILIIVIFSIIFTPLITWYLVIYRGVAREAADWTARFISEYGAFGLLISFSARLVMFLPFWLGWVIVSQIKRGIGQRRHFLALFAVIVGSLAFFTISFLDLVHDLLFLVFRSEILLPYFKGPLITLTTILFLVFFSLRIAYVKTLKTKK